MSFITHKRIGNQEYAYELTSYWDKELKQSRHKSNYLGVIVDKEKNIFKKPLKEKLLREGLILDFGDTFLLHKFLEKNNFIKVLQDSFGENTNMVLNLIFYKLCNPSAMRLAEIWQNGNTVKHLCKAELSSQRISNLMVEIGKEEVYRKFFEEYLSFIKHSSEGLVLDLTAMPNQIHMPFTQWGYHDDEIDKQIKLMLVVDRAISMPLFFRYVPGSISDVSTLRPTVEELKQFNIETLCFIFDASFFSEDNIRSLQGDEIPFIVRLPSGKNLYKDLVNKAEDLESMKYAVRYGKRALFVKKQKIDLFNKKAFAYIVLDLERKGREVRKLILELDEIDKSSKEKEFMLKKKGTMIIVSSIDLRTDEVVPLYYSRQTAEQLFRFSKDDLKLLPLRTHKEESLRGYLLLVFVTLCIFLLLRKKLDKEVTVEEALLLLRNLKAKVFKNEILIPELTKEQRLLFERFDIIVPKVLGI